MNILSCIGIGFAFFMGILIVPFLLGLPIEMTVATIEKKPIDTTRTWFGGWFVAVCISAMYVAGWILKQIFFK